MGRESRVELPRLGDGAAGQLAARDPGREAEVVLDPPGCARLSTEAGAVHHQCLQALRSAIDGGAQAGGAGADNEQVDLLPRRQFEADPQRARDLPGRRVVELRTARQRDQREARLVELRHQRRRGWIVGALGVPPAEREAVAPRELQQLHGGGGRVGADDLQTDPLDRLQRFAPGDKGRQDQIAQRRVLEQQRPQRLSLDRDAAQRRSHERGYEDGLPREKIELTQKSRRTVTDDLVVGGVTDHDLPLADRDERVAPIADLIQHIPDIRGPLLADLGESGQLRRGQRRTQIPRRGRTRVAGHENELSHRLRTCRGRRA